MDIALLESVAAAFVTAMATVWLGSKRMSNQIRTEVTAAEIKDRAAFRKDLMSEINRLHSELSECKTDHRLANDRISHLEKLMSDHGIKV